ncbi:MAG: hypothetical protein E7552_01665 [Ruminococcaceae bacterium]|nr:hypothetical protein [Oscillospiraceae bacterium]
MALLIVIFLFNSGCTVSPVSGPDDVPSATEKNNTTAATVADTVVGECLNDRPTVWEDIPAFSGDTFSVIQDGKPYFIATDITTQAFELYSELDSLGRCGTALACCGKEIMPTGERGSIGNVKPSGWSQAKYDHVDGKYLYNRCHLIGWQLSGENANPRNLITGTRYFNVEGMLPFENMVADYIKETDNHVMYRVTPWFVKNELVARGVQLEAYSVEDGGEGICFNVFCYNVQPRITINYTNGDSTETITETTTASNNASFILNTATKRIHHPACSSIKDIKKNNKQEFHGTVDELLKQGYTTCGNCF